MYLVNHNYRKQAITAGSGVGAVFVIFTFILMVVILKVVCWGKKKAAGT